MAEFWVAMCMRCPYEERALLRAGIAPPVDKCPACGGLIPGCRYGVEGLKDGFVKGRHELVDPGKPRRTRAKFE